MDGEATQAWPDRKITKGPAPMNDIFQAGLIIFTPVGQI